MAVAVSRPIPAALAAVLAALLLAGCFGGAARPDAARFVPSEAEGLGSARAWQPRLLAGLGDPRTSGLDAWPDQVDSAPAMHDLDGDGVDEVVFNGSAGASVYAFDGAAFDLVASAPAVAGPVVFGDLDDDGRGDIVRLDGTGVFVVERGVAGGAFAPAEFFGAAGDEFVTRDLRLCAADDDAVPDVCACTPQGSGGSVSVLSLTGDAVVVSARFDDDDVFVSRCAVFIVDDAVTFVGADSNATAVVVARLSGGALDVVATPGFVNGAPLAFTAADLDGDGSDDIVGVLRGGVVAGFRNAGALGFADARRFVFPDAATLTSTSTALVLAGDGDVRALAR